jgi:hypothetical protein
MGAGRPSADGCNEDESSEEEKTAWLDIEKRFAGSAGAKA